MQALRGRGSIAPTHSRSLHWIGWVVGVTNWPRFSTGKGPPRLSEHLRYYKSFINSSQALMVQGGPLPSLFGVSWSHIQTHTVGLCEITVSNGSDYEEDWDVETYSLVDTYRRFRGAYYLHRPDDGESKHLWNVGQFLRDYTPVHLRTVQCSSYTCTCIQILGSVCTI
jgi:hypothetical protein